MKLNKGVTAGITAFLVFAVAYIIWQVLRAPWV